MSPVVFKPDPLTRTVVGIAYSLAGRLEFTWRPDGIDNTTVAFDVDPRAIDFFASDPVTDTACAFAKLQNAKNKAAKKIPFFIDLIRANRKTIERVSHPIQVFVQMRGQYSEAKSVDFVLCADYFIEGANRTFVCRLVCF